MVRSSDHVALVVDIVFGCIVGCGATHVRAELTMKRSTQPSSERLSPNPPRMARHSNAGLCMARPVNRTTVDGWMSPIQERRA